MPSASQRFKSLTLEPKGFWLWLLSKLQVVPGRSSGVPLNATFRYPAPGSRKETYNDDIDIPARRLSGNPYFQRDTRRNYPRKSIITQDLTSRLLIQSFKAQALKLQDPNTTTKNNELVLSNESKLNELQTQSTLSLSSFLQNIPEATNFILGKDGLPELPPTKENPLKLKMISASSSRSNKKAPNIESTADTAERDIHEPSQNQSAESITKTLPKKISQRISVESRRVSEDSQMLGNNGYFPRHKGIANFISDTKQKLSKYASFIGPGILVSVAYIDPGNYSTDVAAGALYKYKLLFIIFLASVMAVILQCLSCKLGSVTGADLALNCRRHLPWKLNIIVYIFAEVAIIATDLAEVIGCAIALDLLFKIPLPAGVALTIVDVLIVLLAYRPEKSLKSVRIFEFAVGVLVFIVIICFSVMLAQIKNTTFSQVMRGFLPSKTPFLDGIYQSVGIIGATVMPHSLFLGSGIVQTRLRAWDGRHGYYNDELKGQKNEHKDYRPSAQAIDRNLLYSFLEMAFSLLSFALYTNSAILIVSGASLNSEPSAADADLYAIHDLLEKYLSKSAGRLFAVALLFSGMSAGFVATMAGQIVSEGFINWRIRPWLRRLITRSIAILPCMIVAVSVGRSGLGQVLNASQVILSICLPFLVAPLAYFTGSSKIMRAPKALPAPRSELISSTADVDTENEEMSPAESERFDDYIVIKNNFATQTVTWIVWLLLSSLNVIMIVWVAMGKT